MSDAATQCAPQAGFPGGTKSCPLGSAHVEPPPQSWPEHPNTRTPEWRKARWLEGREAMRSGGTDPPDEPRWPAPSHGGHAPDRCGHAVHPEYLAVPTRHGSRRHWGQAGRASRAGRTNRSGRSGQPGQAITGKRRACRAVPGLAGCAVHALRVGPMGSDARANISACDSDAKPMAVPGAFMRSLGWTMQRVRPRVGRGARDRRARVVSRATASPLFNSMPDFGWLRPWIGGMGDARPWTSGMGGRPGDHHVVTFESESDFDWLDAWTGGTGPL
jgi:hypothetical protein